MNIKEIVIKYNNKFENRQDIYSIIKYVTKMSNLEISLNKEIELPKNYEIKITEYLDKIVNEHYPLQYITHSQPFYNEEYYVDENVLIPRQDTEILVEKAIDYINKEKINEVIDLCSGSGAIGISIARNSNIAKAILVDISKEACIIENKNASLNEIEKKIEIVNSNLLEKIINDKIKVNMIVSNPPYIKTKDIASLDENVKKYEPRLALDGGEDGICYYRKILEQAKLVLRNNGILIFEIGYDELDSIKELIAKHKEYTILESVKDYSGNDRVVICRFQQK